MKPRKTGDLYISPNLHSLLRLAFEEMARQNLSRFDVAVATGLSETALGYWRRGCNTPSFLALEVLLNHLGYDLVAQPHQGTLDV